MWYTCIGVLWGWAKPYAQAQVVEQFAVVNGVAISIQSIGIRRAASAQDD